MGLTTEQMFRHIVEMQIELNEKTVPGWLDKGLDWDTAILTEVAEAIDSTDWKWWKHTETDLANLRVEAIDLLHFLVAQIAENAWHVRRPGTGFVNAVCMRLTEAYSWAKVDSDRNKDKNPDYVLHLKGIARHTLNTEPVQAFHHLFMLFSALDMGVEDIYKAYITKNLLNHYRQERGYKDPDGAYLKIINGREDNVIFAEAVGLALAFYNKVSSVDGFDIKTLGQDETEGLGKAILANTSFKIHLKSGSPSIEKIKELAFNLMDDAVNGGLLWERLRAATEKADGGGDDK